MRAPVPAETTMKATPAMTTVVPTRSVLRWRFNQSIAVAMAENMRPFEEMACGDQRIEALVVDEMIVAPVHLSRPDRPRRRRNRHGDAVVILEQHPGDGRLAGAAGA